jgi:putative dimethyl sulfoxide reductase chaperone
VAQGTTLTDAAKARASFYAFLNIHFTELPDESFMAALRNQAFDSVLKELDLSEEVHPEIAEGASLMRSYLFSAKDLGDKEIVNRLGVDRTRLYRGVSSRHGPTPPYEALWIGPDKEPSVLQEMAGIYAQSGFVLKVDLRERLDYIGIQLNYLERLVMNEISAREAGDEELAQESLAQERSFLENHLGKWVPAFVSSALGYAQTDFYRGHLRMLIGFIEQEKSTVSKLTDKRAWLQNDPRSRIL